MGCKFNIISSIFLIISWLLIQTAAFSSIHDSNISSLCTQTPNTNTNFTNNRDEVLTNLTNNAPHNYGYSIAFSSSSGNYLDSVFGLALCRGDVSKDNCTACLSNAKGNITTDCPHNRRAIIWYNFCYLKFADYDFYGQIDSKNKFCTKSVDNAHHPQKFYEKAVHLLGGLSNRTGDKEGMFDYGHVSFNINLKIYAMAQCSRDISSCDCKKCLEIAIDNLQDFSNSSLTIPLGGGSYTGSCFVRYEVKNFLYKNDD
ncbi:hypothetical protein CASFOL_040917 [Castilleja foliolosa]|uniref:Gnk2-homologous domain-containing protein n=1 Tax=Castilleja foliolosa TaxID=1961234 RepID=A0ABD3BDX0_9LAMI